MRRLCALHLASAVLVPLLVAGPVAAQAASPKAAPAAPKAAAAADAPKAKAAAAPADPAQGPRWNVIVVTADTLRGDMLGVNGNKEVKTPRLDALAAEGVNFNRAYANVTTTTPSHASLFSSLYASDHHVVTNMGRLSDDAETLAEVLAGAGWHTAAIINMPWLNPDVSGVAQGVKEVVRGDRIRKADRTNRWVLDFLDRQRAGAKAEAGAEAAGETPFFLWIHYVDNHTPYHAPGAFDRMYYPAGRDPRAGKSGTLQEAWKLFPADHRDNDYFKKWLGGITDADYVVGHYKGSVTWLDGKVGEVIDRLKMNGQWDRTLFVFTADHGESLGEHGIWFAHGGLFEATAHVPLIVRVPEGPAGRKVAAIADLVDVMPTVLGRLGLKVPEAARGDDLWNAMTGADAGPQVALLEHAGHQLTGVVTPRYKYIRHLKTRTDIYPSYPIRRGTLELYDLQADPGETKNLAKSRPELVKELEGMLRDLKAGRRSYSAGAANIDAQTEEALRALGYIQ